MGPLADGNERAPATIDRGASLDICLGGTAHDKLLGDPLLSQAIAFEDRADASVANHRDTTGVFE